MNLKRFSNKKELVNLLSVKRRVERIEEAMRRASQLTGMIVVFSFGGKMKIAGAVNYNGASADGEKLLGGLDTNATIVRFNIPRPGMLEGLGEVEEL